VEDKKDILKRVYIVYACICVFALAIVGRVFFLQFVQGSRWKAEAESLTTREIDIEAVRGNIFAKDGSLLATSLPYFEVGIDPLANEHITSEDYEDSVRLLSNGLAELLKEHTAKEYYSMIMKARAKNEHYKILARNVSYKDLQRMRKLPLFRLGRYKGGFIWLQTNQRERPFRMLASRTIGYTSDSGKVKVGLEGAYDSILTGVSGKRLMRKIAQGAWMPINNDNEIEPQHGKDIVTTIDINIQDVAENALLNSLNEHNAKYGCVVLMEVATGEIRAIANLSRVDSGQYVEDYNYAVGDAEEPGSTFKLASLLVAMDDGRADLDDQVNLNGGEYKYFDRTMKDAHPPKENVVTLQRVFEESSNVGISRIITRSYGKDPKKFTDGLHRLGFGEKLGLSISGEGNSRLKNASDKDWYGTSLPWISIGYESLITPLQTLTLYNAIANNGKLVKPMFVSEVKDKGRVVKQYAPEVINPQIVKPETVKKARTMLEGVVKNGTGKSMSSTNYQVAGKTGTAQIAKGRGYGKDKNNVTYQASFVGYFPADKPKYSCIVIVNAPSGDVYYGGAVAGPIFKKIADRVYANELDIHNAVNVGANQIASVPSVKKGFSVPAFFAAERLSFAVQGEANTTGVSLLKPEGKGYQASNSDPAKQLRAGVMPDLSGFNAADVLFLIENAGYRVRIKGSGAVSKQSILPGTKIPKGAEIILELAA
jgi:cell division protein FtsI (penicillin-binding protein 3)